MRPRRALHTLTVREGDRQGAEGEWVGGCLECGIPRAALVCAVIVATAPENKWVEGCCAVTPA